MKYKKEIKKAILLLFFCGWGIFCLIKILENCAKYDFLDWIIILLFVGCPYFIFALVKRKAKTKLTSHEETPEFKELQNEVRQTKKEKISVPREKIVNNREAYRPKGYIRSHMSPTNHNCDLNENEMIFFKELERKLEEAKIPPTEMTYTRLSSGTFNIDTFDCYVGKINLRPNTIPDKYAVYRSSSKRALRVLFSEQEALDYMKAHNGDSIKFRPGVEGTFYMQYSIGTSPVKELHTRNLQDCLDTIPRWIKYIKYCNRITF